MFFSPVVRKSHTCSFKKEATSLPARRQLNRDCPDQTDSSYHVTLWDGSNYKRAARGGAIGLQAGQKGSDDIASFSPHNDNLLDDGRASFVFPAFASEDYYVDLVAPAFRPPEGQTPAHTYFGPYMLEIYDLGPTKTQSQPEGYGVKASNICVNNRCYNDPRFPKLHLASYANTETYEISVGNNPLSKNLSQATTFTIDPQNTTRELKLDRIGAFVHSMTGSSIPQATIHLYTGSDRGTKLFDLEPIYNDDRHIDYFVAPRNAPLLTRGIHRFQPFP